MSLANAGDDVGSVEADDVCEHGSTLALPSDPHEDGKPLFNYLSACDEPATTKLPNPNGLGQAVPLCEYHAARYREDFPQRFEKVAERFDVDISHLFLLGLDDAPPWIQRKGDEFSRIGIDQRGRAHYYRQRHDDVLILLLDHRLDLVDGREVNPDEYQLGDYLRIVGQRTGWAEIDPKVGRNGGER